MKYPLGIQTFGEIRKEQYCYLDKTALIYELVSSGKAYFLSRPRRFGKSLLISTLEALFCGQKELFEDLAISNCDYDFANHTVLVLEFSNIDIQHEDDLRQFS